MKIDKVLFAFITTYLLVFGGVFTTLVIHSKKAPAPEEVQVTVQQVEERVEEVFPNIIEELEAISLVQEYDGIQELHQLVDMELEELETKLGMR